MTIDESVYDAVVCLPAEICSIIGKYAERRPHTFNNVGLPVGTTTITTTDDGKTTELQIDDRQIGLPWHMFVSDVTIYDGHPVWSIDFETTGSGDINGWIGVGITTIDRNRFNVDNTAFRHMAANTDWILGMQNNRIDLYHKQTKLTDIGLNTADPIRTSCRMRVRFTVDLQTGTIAASWTGNDKSTEIWPPSKFYVANGGNEPPKLATVRPCIALCGSTAVVFRSDPAVDFADVNDEFVLTTALID